MDAICNNSCKWNGIFYGSGGETISSDHSYLEESILAPDAKIVEGFPPGVMSAMVSAGSITDDEADALVAYIGTLS